ncbi:hypothetical protein WJX81_006456 [Elliptochloris bilobata]|uniref:Uncharacterized protein n=1 Tax=Elliptochloris bilobata TaxID=381761 RepID=A0AAW1RTM4_9CHLO
MRKSGHRATCTGAESWLRSLSKSIGRGSAASGSCSTAGGRTCPATGLPLPDQVRLRAAPELQARIHAWAAEFGLEVPAAHVATQTGSTGAGKVASDGSNAGFVSRLSARVRALLAQVQGFFDDAPALYPALFEENWAAQR